MCDTSSYRNFVRTDSATFEELPTSIAPRITFRDTVLRQAISPAERLAVTLLFLATGTYCIICAFIKIFNYMYYINILNIILDETFESLQYLYHIPSQTIGRIVPETCSEIVEVRITRRIHEGKQC